MNWSNVITPNGLGGFNEDLTFSGLGVASIIVRFTVGVGSGGIYYYLNDNPVYVSTTATAIIGNGDRLRFNVGGNRSGTMTVSNDSDGGAVIDTFTYDTYYHA